MLIKAVDLGHVKCVNGCIAAGANVNNRIQYGTARVDLLSSALSCCLNKKRVSDYEDCVELLLEAGAKLTKISLTFAAIDGTERGMKLMLEAGANPNAMLVQGAPRHNILEILINAEADVNFLDKERKPWHHNAALTSAVGSNPPGLWICCYRQELM